MMYLLYGISFVALMVGCMLLGWFIAVCGLISDNAYDALSHCGIAECYKRLFRMFRQHVKTMVFRLGYDSREIQRKDKA